MRLLMVKRSGGTLIVLRGSMLRRKLTRKAREPFTGRMEFPSRLSLARARVLSPDGTKELKYKGWQQWEGAEYQVLEEKGNGDGDPDRGYTCQLFIGKDYLIHRYVTTFQRKRRDGMPSTMDFALRNVHTNTRLTAASFAFAPPSDARQAEKEAIAVRPALLSNGTSAPDFTPMPGKDGKPVKLSDYRGKVVVLDFWATWCQPCMQSLPHTTAMAKKYADKNVVVLVVRQGRLQAWKMRSMHGTSLSNLVHVFYPLKDY